MTSAFEGLIPAESFPFYVLFIEIDPSRIDVNVHPTKQEIKFDDERIVYNYLKVAVRHALGQYSITPTLDFEQELGLKTGGPVGQRPQSPVVNLDDLWSDTRPSTAGSGSNTASTDNSNLRNWRKLYEGLDAFDLPEKESAATTAISVGINDHRKPVEQRRDGFTGKGGDIAQSAQGTLPVAPDLYRHPDQIGFFAH